MKTRVQFNPALLVALLCAAGWFAFWLTAFQPAPMPAPAQKPIPAAISRIDNEKIVRSIQSSRIFALPSAEGFSRGVLEDRIELRPILEATSISSYYLPRHTFEMPALDRAQLREEITTAAPPLPVPQPSKKTVRPEPEPAEFFFDSALQPRVPAILSHNLPPADQIRTFRIHLTIQADGTVARAFFEEPAEEPLLIAIRALEFQPAANSSEGWLELRLNPASGGSE